MQCVFKIHTCIAHKDLTMKHTLLPFSCLSPSFCLPGTVGDAGRPVCCPETDRLRAGRWAEVSCLPRLKQKSPGSTVQYRDVETAVKSAPADERTEYVIGPYAQKEEVAKSK